VVNGRGAVVATHSLSMQLLLSMLRRMRVGRLTVGMPDGSVQRFEGVGQGPAARLDIKDPRMARRVAAGGTIALAETYMDESWDTPDLDSLLDLGVANMDAGWAAGVPTPTRPFNRLRHLLRDNDPAGARRNIEHHYDLGNDFYRLWLDDTLTYSCACFDGEAGTDLETAQRRKWDRILDLIQPGHKDRILEIGCGWGGFAVHAAQQAGCTVTGLTLSSEQAAMARQRVEEHGLDGRVDIRLQDYRHVAGEFSAVASIEMFEAVGEKWWPTFFDQVRRVLKPGGVAGIQTITIADEKFEHYRRNPDFTQVYIFPGGMLPSPARFDDCSTAAGLTAESAPRFFGADYARTLSEWRCRFEGVLPQVRQLGFDEAFIRMWRYYLSYCRMTFANGATDVMQIRLRA
jgi:cyclopropane-fatty-acyl-phospholipid synthase